MVRKKTSRSKAKPSSLTPRLAGSAKRTKSKRPAGKPKGKSKAKARPTAYVDGPGPLGRWWNGLGDDARVTIRNVLLGLLLLAGIIGGGIWAFKAMERHVLAEREGERIRHLSITFADEPVWLSESALIRIRKRSVAVDARFEEAGFLRAVKSALEADPWIRRVEQVTKRVNPQDAMRGEIAIVCEFRQPVAKVLLTDVGMGQGPTTLYLADDGVVLRLEEVAKYVDIASLSGEPSKIRVYASGEHIPAGTGVELLHYPTIEGATNGSPQPGQPWSGADVSDALALAQALQDKPYANQIQRIRIAEGHPRCDLTLDVMADDGRQIEIYFGRLATGETDYVVPMATRIAWLDEFVAPLNGRIGGVSRYINLRRDQIYVD